MTPNTRKIDRETKEVAEFLSVVRVGEVPSLDADFAEKVLDTISWIQQYRSRCLPEEMSAWFQQMQKCLGSSYANVVEGESRGTRLNILNFLRMARGSIYEALAWAKVSGEPELVRLTLSAAESFDRYAEAALKSLLDSGPGGE